MAANAAIFARNPGSFRDPANCVYDGAASILRGVDEKTLKEFRVLHGQPFFQKLLNAGLVVESEIVEPGTDTAADRIRAEGWAGVLRHRKIPFITYPYEWSFSMLKDAALLQLRLIEAAISHGWTLKDATPYNIQWDGAKPVFIDLPSFEPREDGAPWVGYRQFCSMFLIPLMMKAHLGIDYLPFIRSNIEGISPTEAAKFFTGFKRFKSGVFSHVILPAKVEESINKRERDRASAQTRKAPKHSLPMVLGLIQGVIRTVKGLQSPVGHTDWSQYDTTHSYEDVDFAAKKDFVLRNVSQTHRSSVWDIGCNTGTFSRLCTPHADFIISVDGDHDAIERLYLFERKDNANKILPLVMNLANISPAQGWAGRERQAFDHRNKPGFVLCLALIHHIRISANIPVRLFMEWLRSLDCPVVIEFVDRSDEMVKKLLTNRKDVFSDYTLDHFTQTAESLFTIRDRQNLKGGDRVIFCLEPK